MNTPRHPKVNALLPDFIPHLAIGGQGPKNWVKGSVENVLDPLLTYSRASGGRRMPSDVINEMNETYTPDKLEFMSDETKAHVARAMQDLHRKNSMNQWIQSNLANYIRKQMATHDDPIRKLAEQGIVHMPPEQMGYGSSQAGMVREKLGAPTLGQSPEAQAWEDAADVAMNKKLIGSFRGHHREPWMEKADPNTEIFHPTDSMHAHYLGFDHMVDVLKQDLAEGRIRPEQLNKISIEQAVRRVHEYDQERKKAMADAALKATEGMPVHKEYPEGYKWIELAPQPIDENNPLPEGYAWKEPKAGVERLQGPERVYLGQTKTEALKAAHQKDSNLYESKEKPVRDALKYEGDTMGHCVGGPGYPDKVMRGESRIFSLRDAKNEPHVTIEVTPHSIPEGIRNLTEAERNALAQEVKDQYFNGVMPGVRDEDKYFDLIDKHYVAKHGMPPPSIKQIKGKQNAKPKAPYIPYVQDFVKSGKWSDVGDIRNADMWHNRKTGTFHTLDETRANPDLMDAYGSRNIDEAGNAVPLNRRQAHGGPIRLSNGGQPSLDTMRLALIKNGMYSPLEKAAFSVPRTKGTPQEFLTEASKQPGFRKEELEDRPLNLPAHKMTKEDFLRHIMANRAPQVVRHELGGDRLAKLRDQYAKELVGEDYEGLNSMEQKEVDQDIRRQHGEIIPKYEEYTMPGGENYREVLLTKAPNEAEEKLRKYQKLLQDKYQFLQGPVGRHTTPDEQRMVMQLASKAAGIPAYKSAHWNTPNVLAHMRMSDRTGPNGEKLLHLEELQSDWHQEGRKHGYHDPEARQRGLQAIEAAQKAHREYLQQMMEKYGGMGLEYARRMTPEEKEENSRLSNEAERIRQSMPLYGEQPPNAPFKKSWHEMALKHALHEAATKGYHGIAITPASEHFNRYGSERIDWQAHPEGGWTVGATEQTGGHHGGQNVEDLARERGILMEKHGQHIQSKEELARIAQEVLSRENSQEHINKLTNRIWDRMQQEPEGTSMPRKEGMEGFYDKILPDYLNKLGKKHGTQVHMNAIPVTAPRSKHADADDQLLNELGVQIPQVNRPTLHYFPIPDTLRQQIKTEGLPLYKVGGSI